MAASVYLSNYLDNIENAPCFTQHHVLSQLRYIALKEHISLSHSELIELLILLVSETVTENLI